MQNISIILIKKILKSLTAFRNLHGNCQSVFLIRKSNFNKFQDSSFMLFYFLSVLSIKWKIENEDEIMSDRHYLNLNHGQSILFTKL